MAVPETTVDEDHLPSVAENEIRTAGKIAAVEAITIALSVQQPAYAHFDGGVLALDRLHRSPSDHWRFHCL
jgi:hypothetical protein